MPAAEYPLRPAEPHANPRFPLHFFRFTSPPPRPCVARHRPTFRAPLLRWIRPTAPHLPPLCSTRVPWPRPPWAVPACLCRYRVDSAACQTLAPCTSPGADLCERAFGLRVLSTPDRATCEEAAAGPLVSRQTAASSSSGQLLCGSQRDHIAPECMLNMYGAVLRLNSSPRPSRLCHLRSLSVHAQPADHDDD